MCQCKVFYFFAVFVIFQVCQTVKITKLTVPSTYILQKTDNPEPIILDCEYDVSPLEKGFVLKWYYNNIPIYQWIPSRKPFALKGFKDRVDINYEVSEDRLQKYRALVITKPMYNFTGEYACGVQTFHTNDRQSARLEVIVPESEFLFTHTVDEEGLVNLKCTANDISPEPKIEIEFNDDKDEDDEHLEVSVRSRQADDGLFDVTVYGKIPQSKLDDEEMITCKLTIPGTNYTQERDISYHAVKTTPHPEIDEMAQDDDDDDDDGNDDGNLDGAAAYNHISPITMVMSASFVLMASILKSLF